MPRASDSQPLIHAIVTPRFEVFYALQALESGVGEHLQDWRREMERRMPARLRTSLASVAPTPLIWPLLADALRELPSSVNFGEMLESLRRIDARTFQSFVLGGVFKAAGSVSGLVSGSVSLARTVSAEAKIQDKLLGLIGLHPFNKGSPSSLAFDRIVREPGAYRDEVVSVVDSFWTSGFSDTWLRLEPEMRERSREMRARATRNSFAEFATEQKLPITIDGDEIVTMRGGARTPVKSAAGIYLIPSAFNIAKLWAAYADARGRTRFFLPVLDTALSPAGSSPIDPALVFRALGDTTRYAIASSIAHAPMTSVDLARVFGVSKPTISHHVQVLRAAGLLLETQTENGVQLALNRRVLERLSSAAAREMFSESETSPVVKRTRRSNK